MSIQNLTEDSNNYIKTSCSLWQYSKNEPDNNITNSTSFKFKSRFKKSTSYDGTADLDIAVPLKYLGNFQKNLEMPLIICETNVITTWAENVESANSRVTSWNKYQ